MPSEAAVDVAREVEDHAREAVSLSQFRDALKARLQGRKYRSSDDLDPRMRRELRSGLHREDERGRDSASGQQADQDQRADQAT